MHPPTHAQRGSGPKPATRFRSAVRFFLAALLTVLNLSALVAPTAFAAGPELTIAKTGATSILAGAPITYTLTAANPDHVGAVPEYNVGFRDELPVGITYTPGSTTPASMGEPTIYVDPVDGHQTLVWDNVTDLPVGADQALSFSVDVDNTRYPVGSTVTNVGNVYGQSDPRLLPRFDANGDPIAGTASQSASSPPLQTSITALIIRKSEPSPEAELLRGVHRHSTTYTLRVENSGPASTSGVIAVDYIPAGLEFLGCGDIDNSAAVEYPGAPALSVIPNVPADCPTPTRVETVQNPAGLPAGVYTRVEWSIGTMAAGEIRTIRYAAGIPQRANTMTFPGGAPSPTSLGQAANLDNNTGVSTRELTAESSLTNVAQTSGTYSGPVAPGVSPLVGDDDRYTLSIEDVSLQKGVSPAAFNSGSIATYTLTVNVSEYADASNIVVRDLLPDGMCPLGATTNYAPGVPAECAPSAAFAPVGGSFASVVANANGTYNITFNPVAANADGIVTITYQARMRRVYGSSGLPTVSGDDFVNTVTLTGTTTPNAGVNSPDSGPVAITDDSSASLPTDAPSLDKRIQPDVTPYACSASPASYIDGPGTPPADLTFDEGSRVCFLIHINFSGSNSTRNPTLTDFLPAYATYEPGSVVISAGSQPAVLASTDPLRWNIGTVQGSSRFVPPDTFFEVRFSAIINGSAPTAGADITANLAKLAWQATGGRTIGLRDKQEFRIEPAPPVTILKGAARVTALGTPLAEGAIVVADEVLQYSLTVGNAGTAANNNNQPIVGPDVWDVLPDGVRCVDIAAISDGGVCTDPGAATHPTFATRATRSAIRWNLPDSYVINPGATLTVTYRLEIPAGVSVSTSYTNVASVASFGTVSNINTVVQHFPATNVDTTVPANQIDAPVATDPFTVITPNASVAKTNVTAIDETNNNVSSQAVVGEIVTYTIVATIPAHTSVYGAVLADPMPTGLTFLSATAERSVDNGTTYAALPAGFVLTPTNGTLTFPAAYTNATNVNHTFRVVITARVNANAGNTHGVVRTNTASLTSITGPGGVALPPRTGSSNVTIVTPAPSLTKTDNDPDNVVVIGQIVTYTLTVSNANRPPAHDMFVVDCVPAGLTVIGVPSGSPTQGSAAFAPSTGTDGCAAGTTRIVWNVGDLSPGVTSTLDYTATVDDSAAGGQSFTNVAIQTSSTLDDNKAAPGSPDNPNELVINNTATDTITVQGAALAKSTADPLRAVGERATYTIRVTLPADVNFFDAAVVDNLPAGLDVATLQTASVTCQRGDGSSCTVDGTPLTASGNTIGWVLGDLVRDSLLRTVTIVYSAEVADAIANTRGTALTNAANVRWNVTNGINPTSVTATWDQATPTSTATVVVTEPDLSINKVVSDGAPEPGEIFDYTVAVTNSSAANSSAAFGVQIVDTVPGGVVVDPATISNGGVLTGATGSGGGTITWTLAGPIAPGVTVSLTYSAELASPTLTGALVNTADITEYTSIADGGRVYDGPEDTATVTAALPHVVVEKSVIGGDLAYIGEPKAWQITITSDGEATAYGVDAADVLPANWRYDAGSAVVSIDGAAAITAPPATSLAGVVQTLRWTDLADLRVGESLVITFTATPLADVATDLGVGHDVDHVNQASTTAEDAQGNQGPAGGGSYNGGPDTAVAHIDAADVAIDKTHTGDPVAGESFSWTITVSNNGPDTAVGPFRMVDTLPAGVTGASASGSGWTCSVAVADLECVRSDAADTLASGASFPVITVSVDVPADLEAGTSLTNTASVESKTLDPVPDNNTDDDEVTIVAIADLAIEKNLVGSVVAGEQATYTLDVTNLGPSVSRGTTTVSDNLPGGSTFVAASGSGWDCGEAGGVVTCTRDDALALGAVPQISITVAIPADQTADVVNSAAVDGPLDENPDNDADEVTTTPETYADLALEKESTTDFVAGDQGTYRFTVDNNGPSDAQSPVRITDSLPAELAYASFTSVTGTWNCAAVGQDVTCTLSGALAAGRTAVVDIVVDIDPTFAAPVVNTATVTSGTTDPNDANNTDDDNTDVNERADLSVQKSHAGEAVAGQQITFDLAVRNNGPSQSPATVTVTDVLPQGTTFAGFTGAAWTCSALGQVVTCELAGALAARTDAPALSITVDIAPDAGPATLVNRASVDGPATDPVPGNNDATDEIDVVDRANITLVKNTIGANPVVAGEQTRFEIVVHNDGPSDADDIAIVDTLPAGMTLIAAEGAGWICSGDVPYTCTRTSIAAGSDAPVITITVRVGQGVAEGTTLTNAATATTSTPGDDLADNSEDADVEVIAEANLILTKSHPGDPVRAGAATTFDMDVRNEGPSDAVGPLVIADTLPAGMSFVSAAGGWDCVAAGQDVQCSLAQNLLAGASAPTLTVTVQIGSSVEPSDLTNTATANSETTDPAPENNTDDETITVVENADLSLTKSHVGEAIVGEEVVFTLEVANAGPSAAESVRVVDELPAGLEGVTASGTGWTCAVAATEVDCAYTGSLAPGTQAPPISVTVVVLPSAYPGVENTATVSSDAEDPNPADNTATDPVRVPPLVNLSVVKKHHGEFKVGLNGTFTMTVTNAGPTPAPGPIQVTDVLPTGLTFVSGSGAGWTCSATSNVVTCNHGELAVDETTTITLVVEVGPTAYPSVTNVATVGSDSDETDSEDNASEDPVQVNPLVVLALAKETTAVTEKQAVFELTVTNRGPNAATEPIVLEDPLPSGLAFESAAGAGWACSAAGQLATCVHAGPLAVGDSTTVRIVTAVTAVPGSEFTNIASVRGGGSDATVKDDAPVSVPASVPTSAVLPFTGGFAASWLRLAASLLLFGFVLAGSARRARGGTHRTT